MIIYLVDISLLYNKPFICIVKELNIDLRHIDHLQSDHLHKYATFVSLFHAGLLNFLYEVIYRWDVQRLSSYGLSILRLYFKSTIINMGKNGTRCILKYWEDGPALPQEFQKWETLGKRVKMLLSLQRTWHNWKCKFWW